MVENGIKPAYVFDGKPPELKAGVVRAVFLACGHSSYVTCVYQLSKRFERREEAKEENEESEKACILPGKKNKVNQIWAYRRSW